eukprot:6190531-Pleurochrysis_carterae.AAC.1
MHAYGSSFPSRDMHLTCTAQCSSRLLLQAKLISQVSHSSLLQTMFDHAVNRSTECARLVSETCSCQSRRKRSG